jgi:hypothetical protein
VTTYAIPEGDPVRHYDNVTRLEVVGPGGREHVGYYMPGVVLELQDDGRTLKLFVGERRSL